MTWRIVHDAIDTTNRIVVLTTACAFAVAFIVQFELMGNRIGLDAGAGINGGRIVFLVRRRDTGKFQIRTRNKKAHREYGAEHRCDQAHFYNACAS